MDGHLIERPPPLARQLDLRDGMRVWFHAMPDEIHEEIAEYALELRLVGDPARGVDGAHVFVRERRELSALLDQLRRQIAPDGQVWVSWPAQAADISEDNIRQMALPLGFVDTKACAINDAWSGLKLVIRKDLR